METYEEARAAILRNLGQTLLTDRPRERLRFRLTGRWSPAVVDQRLLVSALISIRSQAQFRAQLDAERQLLA